MTEDLAYLPPHVRGGKARMRKLVLELEAHGLDLATYQRGLYDKAITAHPDLPQRGAAAANRAQLEAWGIQGYIQQRRDAFRACAEKYGDAFARQCVKRATESRRQHRLLNPTRGEQALRDLLTLLGFVLVVDTIPFDYCRWCVTPEEYGWPDVYPVAITSNVAIVEAYVDRYICDVLIPTQQLAIEVYGGVHAITSQRDAQREAFLKERRLRVLILTEDQVCDSDSARSHILQALTDEPSPRVREQSTFVHRNLKGA